MKAEAVCKPDFNLSRLVSRLQKNAFQSLTQHCQLLNKRGAVTLPPGDLPGSHQKLGEHHTGVGSSPSGLQVRPSAKSFTLQSAYNHPNQSGICCYSASVGTGLPSFRLLNIEPSLELQAASSARFCLILWKSLLHLATETRVHGTKNGGLS